MHGNLSAHSNMAVCDADLSEVLEREFEKWSEDSGSDKIFLIESSQAQNGKVSMQLLLESEHEIKLHIPAGYPSYSDTFLVEGGPTLQAWCNALNEFFQDSSSGLKLVDVLNKAITLSIKSNGTADNNSSDEEISEDEETQEAGAFSFGEEDEKFFTTEWELFVARKKSAWRKKEKALRDGMESSHVKDSRKQTAPSSNSLQQMFSFPASSGILSNDLVDIMAHEKDTGISSEPLDDNIFKWIVRLSKFQKDSALAQDLCSLNEKFGYDYVELQMDFAMDLYPFYPPIVKLIRPRLQGLKGENLCNFDWQQVYQLSYWNPTNSMHSVLQHVKNFLESNMRVHLSWARNYNVKYPKGAYLDIEDALLRVGVVTEIPPRGGHVAGYPVQVVPKTFTTSHVVPPRRKLKSHAHFFALETGSKVSGQQKFKSPFTIQSGNVHFQSSEMPDYWAKGIGFGHSARPSWDVDAFQAAQAEKDRQIEQVLGEVQQELEKLRLEKSVSTPDFAEDFSAASTSSSGYSNNQNNNNNETPVHHNNLIDLTWEEGEAKESFRETLNSNGNVTCMEAMEGVEEENSDSMELFSILEGSSLIPFLEQQLKVDSFLEICRHTGLYQVVIQIIKEIAMEKTTVPLLSLLPKQEVSLHLQLKRIAEKANFIILKLEKVSANGCIPGMAHTSGVGGNATSHPGSPNEPQMEHYQTLRERSAEEKIAREFADLFVCVSNALQESGCLSQEEPTPESEEEDDKMDSSSTACLNADLSLSPEESLAQSYRLCLKPLQFESWSMECSGPYVHKFMNSFETGTSATTPQLVLRVAQELASLSTSLPLDLSSAIFARTDDDKCTLMRALITGPEGTPYSSGCFLFDIYFPNSFPKVPPQVNFRTTGNGKVRFNPNLYENGQVCLSLLNTWIGEKGEQWHEMSTVLQVLVSIQSLILVAEPYFNEPGFEKTIGTAKGKERSSAYNYNVRCNNIQLAMLDQLVSPSPGFEEVIKAHFYIKRHRIIKETESWCTSDRRLRTLVNKLKVKLLSLEAPNEDVAKLAVP